MLLKLYKNLVVTVTGILFLLFCISSASASSQDEMIGTWRSEYSILMKDNALFSSTTFTISKDSVFVEFKRRTTDSNDIFFGSVIPGKLLTIIQAAKIDTFVTFSDSKGAIVFSISDNMFNGLLAILYEKVNPNVYRYFLDGKIVESLNSIQNLSGFETHNFLLMTKDSLFETYSQLNSIPTLQSVRDFQRYQQKLVPMLQSNTVKQRADLASKDDTEVLTNIYIITETLQEMFLKENKNPYKSNHRFFQFLINEVIKDYNTKLSKGKSKKSKKDKEELNNLQYKVETLQQFLQQMQL